MGGSDTLTYEMFKYAVITMETQSYPIYQAPAFKPALILGATFAVNTYLFMNYSGNKQATVQATTAVFIVGGLLSVLTYFVQ